ncbi:hypothetical protein GCK32_014136 [Trichostrongylus colubriformis]|uniref:Uncharacterized protein n=1 Tax=Trichostrongylus colubriformis TaxID=6319 RepID=A0AAN8FVB9_TRICO
MEFTDKVNLPQGHELPTDTQGIHSSLEGAPAPISSASPGGEAEPLEALLDDPMGSPLPSLEGAPWFFDGPAPMDACDFVDNEIVIPSLDMAELLISSESSLPPDNSQVGLADFAPPMSSDEQPCLLPKTEQPGGEEAAYGTGKTVVGALIAARTYSNFKERVIATTTTNNAVAQFTDTLLGLDDFRHLDVLRYVSDSALVEGAPQTPIDLHNILKRLPEDFGHLLSQVERRTSSYSSPPAPASTLPEATSSRSLVCHTGTRFCNGLVSVTPSPPRHRFRISWIRRVISFLSSTSRRSLVGGFFKLPLLDALVFAARTPP